MYDFFIQLGEVFLQFLNISITASWLVLAIIIAKFLLKKAPKWINCVLWGLVAIRLLVPFDIESPFSLIPSRETMPVTALYSGNYESLYPQVDSGFEVVDAVLQPAFTEAPSRPVQLSNISIIACIWLLGIIIMLVYSFISYRKIKKTIKEAMRVQENIYLCDNISTPFILGLIKPKIYLPSSLYRDDVLYVIDHEKAHIKRFDHLWKPLGYLILTLYWFNPVMWVAYVLLCKDIELACDEKVIKELDTECKKEYSNALINCSSQRRLISACPLAFGETGVKDRIKSVLSYKKPAFWVIVVALVICVAVSVAFLTVPSSDSAKDILDERGYKIVAQEDEFIPVKVPVSVFTDEIHSEKGQRFEKNQVVVFDRPYDSNSYCQTNIYLEEAIARDSTIDLCFRFSYDQLQDSGVIYTGYNVVENGYTYNVSVRDINSLRIDGEHYYEEEAVKWFYAGDARMGAMSFAVSVSKDAFNKAKENIAFDIGCTKTGYKKNSLFKSVDSEMCEFIEKTILEKETKAPKENVYKCASFIPVKTERVDGNTKVYIISQLGEFTLTKGTIFFSGEKSPHLATITVKKEKEGYSLVDYWALDGYKSSYTQIKEHFPETIWKEVDHANSYYYDVLCMENHAKANAYFEGRTKDYTGTYVFYGSREAVKPTLVLKANDKFVFNCSALSSEFLTGYYEISAGHHLILYADNNKTYMFTITEEGFKFDAYNSADIPEYKVSADSDETYCPVSDDAVFIPEQTVGVNSYFDATVLEVNEGSVLVEPFKNEPINNSANKLSVSTKLSSSMSVPYLRVGDEIRVCYDGMIQETFPAHINGTIAIYMLKSSGTDENNYVLGYEGATKIIYMIHNENGEKGEEITDEERVHLFIQRFNEALDGSSIDEEKAADKDFEDNIAYVGVYYADDSQASIRILGEERIRLGVNERRLISQHDKDRMIEVLVNGKNKIIEDIANGDKGRVNMKDNDFLKKAYALKNSETKEELKSIFGVEPGVTEWEAIDTYYFTNGELVVLIGPNTRVELRKLSEPEYRHTIA